MNGLKMTSLKEDDRSGIIYRQWTSNSPKAVLLLVHGLDAHSGRWRFLGEFLSERGVSSYALELKGFGETKGLRGHVDSFDIYFDDILRLYDIIRQENPGKKMFILGESMGALIAYLTAVRKPGYFGGLICLSPAIRSALPFSFFDYIRMVFDLIFNPRKQLNMPFDSKSITRDAEYQKVMDADILEHRLATPKMLLNVLLAQAHLSFLKNKLKLPILFLIAGSDKLVNAKASKEFFESLGAEDKQLIEYPGMFHSLSIEYEKEKILEQVSNWVLKKSVL